MPGTPLTALSEFVRRRPRLAQRLDTLLRPIEYAIKKPIFDAICAGSACCIRRVWFAR
jgi:hypothetical protein